MPEGERRLAAIMFTDMIGYTSLGQRNESLSLALVEEQRKLLRPILRKHSGREVKTIGDGFLVEFSNALDAVRCAYDIQRTTKEFNISLPSEKGIHLRVGIHLGDIVESQGDISGDAVNIASRIEPLAEDGGVCLTRQVYDQIQNKFQLPLVSLGSKSLKNIAMPIEVYRMTMPWDETKTVPSDQSDKTRIAILPFANISPDTTDEYFADGMTEELIDRLSQVGELRVIARTSVMGYKKTQKKIYEIGKELGVRTLVEGSVRKSGDRIRVTVQLIDAGTEEHIWSSRYDKNLDDIFAVQSDIASSIVTALAGTLAVQKAPRRMLGRDTENITAYSCFLRGRHLLNENTVDSIQSGLKLLERAVDLDPFFARAHAYVAAAYTRLEVAGGIARKEAMKNAWAAARKAVELDEKLAEAHAVLSEIAWMDDRFGNDEIEARRAIELNPNLAYAYERLGLVKLTQGYPKEALRLYETAYLLDPLSARTIRSMGMTYLYLGREREAEELWTRTLQIAPKDTLYGMSMGHIIKGNYDKAEETIRALESGFPEDFWTIAIRGFLEALKGNREKAEQIIEKLYRKYSYSVGPNQIASFMNYFLGDTEAFFAGMFRDLENDALNPVMLRYSPLLEKARRDPRYRELMIKNGLDPDLKE